MFYKPEVHANSVQLTCPYRHRSITLYVDSLENMTEYFYRMRKMKLSLTIVFLTFLAAMKVTAQEFILTN